MTRKLIERHKADPATPECGLDILMIRPESYSSVDILLKRPGERVRGFQFIDIDGLDGAGLVDAIGKNLDLLDEGKMADFMEETFPASAILKSFAISSADQAKDADEAEELLAINGFLKDHCNPDLVRAIAKFRQRVDESWVINIPSNSHIALTDDAILDFLTTGDGKVRAQALNAAPFFADDIIGNNHGICDLIDARAPLHPAMEKITRLTQPARLKALLSIQAGVVAARGDGNFWEAAEKLTGKSKGLPGTRTPERVVPMLSSACARLPLHLLRSGLHYAEEMVELSEAASSLEVRLGINADTIDRMMRKIDISEGPMLREKLLQAQEKLAGFRDYRRFLNTTMIAIAANDVLKHTLGADMERVHSTARKVLASEPVTREDAITLKTISNALDRASRWGAVSFFENLLREELARTASLKTLEELNTRWHHNTQRIADAALAGSSDVEWEPFLGETAFAGLRIREITSSSGLRRQGDLERHCVGSYTQAVLDCTEKSFKLIFSIENGEQILSTLEVDGLITQSPSGKKTLLFEMGQNLARGNKPPSAAASRAAEALMGELAELPIEHAIDYTRALMSDVTGLRESVVRTMRSWGANVFDSDLRGAMRETLAPILPPRMRDLEFLSDLSGIEGLLKLDLGAFSKAPTEDLTP